MGRVAWSFIIWGPWVVYFTVFELIAVFTRPRWLTLSSTVDHVEKWWWPFQFIILVGLAILMVHWFVGGPISLAVEQAKKLTQR